jgi:hypothetical protein
MKINAVLMKEPDDTAVIGDVDAFINYLERGYALQDWRLLHKRAEKEIEREWGLPALTSWDIGACHMTESR